MTDFFVLALEIIRNGLTVLGALWVLGSVFVALGALLLPPVGRGR